MEQTKNVIPVNTMECFLCWIVTKFRTTFVAYGRYNFYFVDFVFLRLDKMSAFFEAFKYTTAM